MNETRASVETFDLTRHAVVEASAGTGKTYTIERLVLRLLTEEKVALEKILIVTFTEKATGELKDRLRGMLERAIRNDDPHANLLKPALDHFDQAPIFTIHGFCQRLLQEYALEQGQDFRADLVNDPDLLKTALRDIQRKDWRTFFGASLKAVLDKALYGRDSASEWDKKVLAIAGKYKPRCGHQLKPAFTPDWHKRLDEPDQTWAGQLEIFTIDLLHQHLREFKRTRGMQSFDDMIAAVEENLDVEKNTDAETFLIRLRERFSHGIVDEFQDTDPLQWRIVRRIFLAGGASKLFIVADPKQAIFGFRGADLPTYLEAAKEMQADFNAVKYPLDENWRSEPDLLDALNCLFGDGVWFPPETDICYVHVHAPDDDKRLTRRHDDKTNRPALTIVDMTQWDKLTAARKHYGRFVAQEIDRLLTGAGGQPLLSIELKRKPARPIDASDICILVMKRAESEPIIQALDQIGIPYSFYKQTGLWRSDEATHLEVLLQTLARPEDRTSFRKALLTCFFRVKPEELVRAPDVPMAHPARQLYQTWLGHVENRAWSALCRSLLEDTGLLFPAQDDREADRRVTNLRHLLSTLEQEGHGKNLDLLGLLDWIKDCRDQRDPGDADVQPVEMDKPKVKIMTIHACKGLEFPIVFLAGGFTQGLVKESNYRDDQGRVVFDLYPDGDAQERMKADRLSEHRRLLYVALTRPIFKLYIPKIKKPTRSSHFLGPLGTVLMPALERACPDKCGDTIAQVITPSLAVSVPRPLETQTAGPVIVPIHLKGSLFPVVDPNLGKRRIVTRSFSSMTKYHLSQVGEGSSFGEQTPTPVDEAATPVDHEDPLRGPVFGDMVHNVLEKIDFDEVGNAAVPDNLVQVGTHARKLIDDEVKAQVALLRTRTPIANLEDACRQQIAGLVWHALKTPLAAIEGPLWKVLKPDRLPEIEFLYPEEDDGRLEERFITGFMDLLFRQNGKYYLLDWKTNLLPGYSREHLERSMADADYHRQYRLYLQAIRRWLKRGDDQGDFLKQFGGVYYLYVRGLNGRDETTGVYFHRPTEEELDLAFVLRQHG